MYFLDQAFASYSLSDLGHSRWLTIGTSMRTLLAALALGLHRLHAVTLADPLVGSWYIGGFNRLTPAMIRYAVIAAVASRPSESLSVALLEDDRAVMNIDSYEAQLREELEWVYSVDLQVFQLLGTLVGPDAHACVGIHVQCGAAW